MNILLIGLIGSGKSSVGRNLAQLLNYKFVESDAETLEHTGFSSVEEVYEVRASLWKENEIIVMHELSKQDKQVIACGGGVVENDINFLYFRENCPKDFKVIYLKAKAKTLAKRISVASNKMTINELNRMEENIEQLIEKRSNNFEYYADYVLETDDLDLSEVVQRTLKLAKVK